MNECIFCKIVAGEIPSYKILEDEEFLAFLSIFSNTEGVTVVIPKKHYPSYVFDLPYEVLNKLMSFTKKVAKMIDSNLNDVGRTAVVFEGFGVDHIHAKLFPMHGTANMKEWKPLELGAKVNNYFEKYPGYISSHDCDKVGKDNLEKTAKKIRGEEK